MCIGYTPLPSCLPCLTLHAEYMFQCVKATSSLSSSWAKMCICVCSACGILHFHISTFVCGRFACACVCVRVPYLWGGASPLDWSCCAWRRSPFPATEPGGGCARWAGGHSEAPWHSWVCTHHRAHPGPTLRCSLQHCGLWGADLPPLDPGRRGTSWRAPSGSPRSKIRSGRSATEQWLSSWKWEAFSVQVSGSRHSLPVS